MTARAFGRDGLEPVKTARNAMLDWYLDNKDNFGDRKIINLRGRKNRIFRYTYCARFPEHIFCALRIENR